MRAMLLKKYQSVEKKPLNVADLKPPKPGAGEVLVRISASGVCRTDLHVIEKELKPSKLPVIPGHQIVGTVFETGKGATRFKKGDRVGITWINSTCGSCRFCRSGRENLCEKMRFTGYDVDGGYAEYTTVSQDFAFPIPENFDDVHAAPLFCAGIIGYRAFKLSGVEPGGTLGIFGFGASGHILAQIAKYWDVRVLAFTRGKEHQERAKRLGAVWAGEASDNPPEKINAAIITAPAGELVLNALSVLEKGGKVTIQDIHMSPIPQIDYDRYLYQERWIGSVANYTRDDAVEFLNLASRIPIKTDVEKFKLEDANRALILLKQGKMKGAGVLEV